MQRKVTFRAAGAALCALTLAGCGSSSSAGTSTTSAAATSAATTPAEATAGYTDAEACAWLKQNLGDLPDTEIGAMTQLTLGLSTFFEEHGGLENADGYVLDEALTRGCPDVREQALKKAGIKTFGNL